MLDDSRPTYLQVADVLRAEIRSGQLPVGERVPSVRDLSDRFEIAPVTTQSALRVLRDEGLIVSRSTRGYFVRDELPAEQPAASAEYATIREQLTSVQNVMHELVDRISHLEAVVLPSAAADPPESPRPVPGPDDSGSPSPR